MLGDMTIQRIDNVAIVVEDLDAALAFFTELGMELDGTGQVDDLGDKGQSPAVPRGCKKRQEVDPAWPPARSAARYGG